MTRVAKLDRDVARLITGIFALFSLPGLAGPVCAEPVKPKPKAASEKTYHCYKVQQKNMIFGECTVYAAPQALKIVFTNGKWMNIARAPDWELYVLNPREKVMAHTSLKNWRANRLQLSTFNEAARTQLFTTKETKKIAGLNAVKIIQTARSSSGAAPTGSYFWVAKDVTLPDQIYHVMCGNSLIPQLHKMPLSVSLSGSTLGNSLQTSAASEVDMPVSFFDLPKGFKMTDHPEDIMNTGVMDIVKDMVDF